MAKKKVTRRKTTRGIEQQILAELKRITARLEVIHEKLEVGIDVEDSSTHSALSGIHDALSRRQ